MNKEKLINLATQVAECVGTEQEQNELIGLLDTSLPNSDVIDMIFHPDKERTIEEIIDVAMAQSLNSNNSGTI